MEPVFLHRQWMEWTNECAESSFQFAATTKGASKLELQTKLCVRGCFLQTHVWKQHMHCNVFTHSVVDIFRRWECVHHNQSYHSLSTWRVLCVQHAMKRILGGVRLIDKLAITDIVLTKLCFLWLVAVVFFCCFCFWVSTFQEPLTLFQIKSAAASCSLPFLSVLPLPSSRFFVSFSAPRFLQN